MGYESLHSNTTSNYNTALGSASLYSNTTGTNNTAVGFDSLISNTTGARNTALGYESLYNNTSGGNNTAVGPGVASKCTIGAFNTLIGSGADVSSSDAQHQIVIGADEVGKGDHTAVIGGDSVHMNTIVLGCQSSISSASSEPSAAQDHGVDGQIRYCSGQLQLYVQQGWKTVLLST